MGKSNKREEGQYVPLPYSQLRSPAWRDLSGPAVKLWLELHTRFHGGNNGHLTLSYAEAGEILGMGKATVQRATQDWHRWQPQKTKRGSEMGPSALSVVPFENPKGRYGSG